MYHSVLATDTPNYIAPPRVTFKYDEQHTVKMATLVPTSRATSLGASISALGVVKHVCSRRAIDRKSVTCLNIPDELAMHACLQFAGIFSMLAFEKRGSVISDF